MNDIDLIHYMLLMNIPAYVFLACLVTVLHQMWWVYNLKNYF
ncbi:hypothetical protein GF598_12400 [Staphylococcus aureus]|nr:hypothetical protein [Staphylococcus aureus]MRU80781.1 hypothetical protein [Staphylococcus aureus]MRV08121.1 hypothetical protein [Staphylococcus aureus]MRV47731.1 hypothetical protein [Staphylococcus aureus]MRV95270.1 hypothetical protein [Staphylococcus aureus]